MSAVALLPVLTIVSLYLHHIFNLSSISGLNTCWLQKPTGWFVHACYHRVRLGVCAPAGASIGLGAARAERPARCTPISLFCRIILSVCGGRGREPQESRWHALAERLRTPLFKPDGVFGTLHPVEQEQLQHKAKTLAEVFQRSSSNVEGSSDGISSLRNHQLRGLDHPRKRVCLTTIHNFFLTPPDGTTAAERFFGQKPRSLLTTVLDSVAIPPALLSPPPRAME